MDMLSEIEDGLWMGQVKADLGQFDVVIDMTESGVVHRGQKQLLLKYPILDKREMTFDPHAIRWLAMAADMILGDGKSVAVVCGAGLNRSGLVVARTLMCDPTYSVAKAIETIRRRRSENALSNTFFVTWLESEATNGGG